ncbi:MAG: S41 family peptidase [Bacteroidetes bacterium]|nr:S41 family peptidase [Bacteroidota bacterium]
MKRNVIIILMSALLIIGLQSNQDRYFEISKNIETFNKLFKELNRFYVDDVDPTELMEVGINAMLESLDPYTVYLSGAELDNYRMQTTGKYGGIGARIGMIEEKVMITEPYEGFPAYNAGLRAGDVIIEVDGKSTEGYNTEDVSQILRGQPGTDVTVKIHREVSDKTDDYVITRGEVKIDNVPYFGMLNDDIGYIKLTNFAESAGKEVGDALQALKTDHNVSGIVLDLRGNGGGLLHEAVNVSNVFIDKGIEIVSTKGKVEDSDKSYKTLNKAVDSEIPLVVLTDAGSASASEIVSGSIQDLDRGVIIGQRSYGKGLVQITRPLPYKSKLKVTTSKYYIPSGRCIQAIDYVHRSLDEDAFTIPDSLRRAFETKGGRRVLDGAGIEPDLATDIELISNVTRSLLRNNHIFHYATEFWNDHPELREGPAFTMNDDEFSGFLQFLEGKEYEYSTSSERKLEELLETSKKESYYSAIEESLKELEEKMSADKKNDIEKNKAEIKRILELEIVGRYEFQQGRIEASLIDDPDVIEAIGTIVDNAKYIDILAAK